MSIVTTTQLPPLLVPEHADACLVRMRLHLERGRELRELNARLVAYDQVIKGTSFQLWWNPLLTTEQRDALVALRTLAEQESQAIHTLLVEIERLLQRGGQGAMSTTPVQTSGFRHQHGKAFISMPLPTLMYVLIDDHTVFDAIPLPATEHANCLSKSQQSPDGLMIVFQWWPPRDHANKELLLELPAFEEADERQEQTLCTPA